MGFSAKILELCGMLSVVVGRRAGDEVMLGWRAAPL